MRANRIGVPPILKDSKAFNRQEQGEMEWQMPNEHGMSRILWKDKKPVLLLSTIAMPIGFPCVQWMWCLKGMVSFGK
jgi:hypothetical protein